MSECKSNPTIEFQSHPKNHNIVPESSAIEGQLKAFALDPTFDFEILFDHSVPKTLGLP